MIFTGINLGLIHIKPIYKIKLFMKSGNVIKMDFRHFEGKKDCGSWKSIEWVPARIGESLIQLNIDEIEATQQYGWSLRWYFFWNVK